jgi:hypothetical protein
MNAIDLPLYTKEYMHACCTSASLRGSYRNANGFDVYIFIEGVCIGFARYSSKHNKWRAARSVRFNGVNMVSTGRTLPGLFDTWRHACSELLKPGYTALNHAVEILRNWDDSR